MGYILKNTSGLINTRLTDAGRQKLSQGNFNISYFQIGDSEISYNVIPNFNNTNYFVFEPSFGAQNTAGAPQSNKENIKYPIYVDDIGGNTYGIPFMDSIIEPVYNTAVPRGFFTGTSLDDPNQYYWSALTNNLYAINSNYVVKMNTLNGSNTIDVIYNNCNPSVVRGFSVGDIITIYYDGSGLVDCNCSNLPSPTPTPSVTSTPSPTPSFAVSMTPTPTPTQTDFCSSPTPTPTPTKSPCVTPTPSNPCPQPLPPNCVVSLTSCFPILTYKIVGICLNTLTLDRATPDFSYLNNDCYARTIIYPPNMTEIYDSITPSRHWNDSVINFESVCYTDQFDVNIWNMNIPWSENPAGLDSSISNDYTKFGSVNYLGSKEYLGYASSSGQTDTSSVFYFNSFNEIVEVLPEEQKAISIVHYTNQTIDLFYGEKFALQPFDDTVDDTTGQARNFKIHIPWLMWHKNPNCCLGQTFWIDPPGFDELDLFQVHYLKSTKNVDMNDPGIRYFHLWDNNPNVNALIPNTPNRVGKVFPDLKIIIIDDEELIAAMSYKANRNWTLPAPKVALITPNICGLDNTSVEGILTGNTEYLYVTYRLSNSMDFTNSLHCNYYQLIQGPNTTCNPIVSQNVSVRFGGEFGCLNNPYAEIITTTTTTLCPTVCNINTGFSADKFEIICQKVVGNQRPEPTEWKIIDFTDQVSATTINGYLTESGLTGNTFVITQDLYDNANAYVLTDYIDLPSGTTTSLNFGDEYYFYGNIETDIQATIYEMRYKINLGQSEFLASSNPTWDSTKQVSISEIGLYDSNKTLMIVSKLQSPYPRTGIQQFLVKFDF
jgi:hypothetical protein